MNLFCKSMHDSILRPDVQECCYEVEVETLGMHDISQTYKFEREKQLEKVGDANCHTAGQLSRMVG